MKNFLSKSEITLSQLIVYFFFYSVIGWCYEVFLEVVIYRWGFSNRGVLFGPYTPVYGFGAAIFILTVYPLIFNKPLKEKLYKIPLVFILCMAIATFVELITSYILEFLTGSWPWQTYADYDINFQARIALSPSIRFGLGGVLFLYIIQPCFEKFCKKIGRKKTFILSIIFVSILSIDCLFLLIPKKQPVDIVVSGEIFEQIPIWAEEEMAKLSNDETFLNASESEKFERAKDLIESFEEKGWISGYEIDEENTIFTFTYSGTDLLDGFVIPDSYPEVENGFTDEELLIFHIVDNELLKLQNTQEYKEATQEERVNLVKPVLQKLKDQNYINSFLFDDIAGDKSVYFEYANGISGGWLLYDFKWYLN